VRKEWHFVALCVGLALVAVLVWLGVEDARRGALVDARAREAHSRVHDLIQGEERLRQEGAPEREINQVRQELRKALEEASALETERHRRQQSWRSRLPWEGRCDSGR
jgi:hypothetical protein